MRVQGQMQIGRPLRRLLLLALLVIAVFVIIIILPKHYNIDTGSWATEIDPELQLQRFGLVSEDGVIEADKIEKYDREEWALERENRRKVQLKQETQKRVKEAERLQKVQKILQAEREDGDNNDNAGPNTNNDESLDANKLSDKDARNKRRKDRYKKAQERKKSAILKNRKKVANQNLVNIGMMDSPKLPGRKRKSSSAKAVDYSAMTLTDIDNYILAGEPEGDLDTMTLANRETFLRKVSHRKDVLLGEAQDDYDYYNL